MSMPISDYPKECLLSPSPSGEGLGWGLRSRRIARVEAPPPGPPLKGRGEEGARFTSLLALFALSACSGQADQPAPQNLQQTRPAAAPAPTAEHIPCARDAAPLTPVCTLDRRRTATGQLWTIRFPDGGFRRLRVVGDEVSEADGAEPLTADGGTARIGAERYKLPTR